MPELKTKKNNASVSDFINAIADGQKKADSNALVDIFEDITGEPAKMWGSSIVGFGERPYKRSDGSEHNWMLTGFSPRKANLTLYIMSGFEDHDSKTLLEKLGPHSTGKSCLYIKKLSDIDEKILRTLIAESLVGQGQAS